jgi:gas vesicle protein
MSDNPQFNGPSSSKYQNDPNTTFTFIAGLLVGGLVGLAAMMLLAPQSGEKTRAQIQLKSLELRDQTSGTVEDAVTQAGAKFRLTQASLRKQAKELEQSSQAMLDEQKKRWSTLVEAGKTAVRGS